MRWLHEHGILAAYGGLAEVPVAVLEDARLLMEAEAIEAKRQAQMGRR